MASKHFLGHVEAKNTEKSRHMRQLKNRNKYTPRKRGLRRHLAWNIPIQTGNSIKSAFAVQEFAKRAHQMQKLLTCTRQLQMTL